MGCSNSKGSLVNQLQASNGVVNVGSRVTYCHSLTTGGNNNWYVGYIQQCYSKGMVTILFDDGDKWDVNVQGVYLYQPPFHNVPVQITNGSPYVIPTQISSSFAPMGIVVNPPVPPLNQLPVNNISQYTATPPLYC